MGLSHHSSVCRVCQFCQSVLVIGPPALLAVDHVLNLAARPKKTTRSQPSRLSVIEAHFKQGVPGWLLFVRLKQMELERVLVSNAKVTQRGFDPHQISKPPCICHHYPNHQRGYELRTSEAISLGLCSIYSTAVGLSPCSQQ